MTPAHPSITHRLPSITHPPFQVEGGQLAPRLPTVALDQVGGATWSASAVGRPRGQAGDELQPAGPPTHAPPLPRRLGMDTPIPHGDGQRYALAVEHAWTAA
ncbi:hypothetical protein XFF6994_610004 [Xanthomonas citri pv. fuscans]|uniref:Uncharacterized protein n=1 Tax=Xanthomonas campestris pv. phaseoli TaxID=317013 RepID=A0A7Z7IX77_XANCH|nr:hypothetical protein XFF4834R_pla00040 [Xanthomonas citri pv. fuscans]SOO23267.1 hypothetical protein XFF6991_200003 [Xanthomonas phaseoli pv. phaseoli]SOO35908.1 hypothetical protein XFF6994_610004 [Xanthomonas citri pv. fuscans]